jgi:hypothetical protein
MKVDLAPFTLRAPNLFDPHPPLPWGDDPFCPSNRKYSHRDASRSNGDSTSHDEASYAARLCSMRAQLAVLYLNEGELGARVARPT